MVEHMQGMLQRVDTLAHNLSNASTHGFKRLMAVHDGKSLQVHHDLSQGMHRATGHALDLAIEGKGFLVAQAQDGRELLTRHGALKTDTEGYLVTPQGYRVLGDTGPIQIDPTKVIEVDTDGTIRQDRALVGKLRLVEPAPGATLRAVGQAYLEVVGNQVQPANGRVESGHLEHSNVQPLSEMTDFLSAQRAFDLGQKALMVDGEVRRRLTEEVGRTR